MKVKSIHDSVSTDLREGSGKSNTGISVPVIVYGELQDKHHSSPKMPEHGMSCQQPKTNGCNREKQYERFLK